jgi:hypothetical protein
MFLGLHSILVDSLNMTIVPHRRPGIWSHRVIRIVTKHIRSPGENV